MTDTMTRQTITEESRSGLSQVDHDQITRLTVLVETVLTKITGVETQLKDAMTTQTQALTALDLKTTTNHNNLEMRLRKMEDLATQYVPLAATYSTNINSLQKDVEILKTNRSEVIASWKIVVWIIGSMAGFASFIWIIAQLVSPLFKR